MSSRLRLRISCERPGIKAEISDKGAYLLKVRLRKAAKAS